MIKKLVLLFVLSVVLSLNLIIPVLAEDYHDTVIETDIKEIQAQDIISGNVTVTFNNMNLYNENVKFSYHIQDENGNDILFENERTPLVLEGNKAVIPFNFDKKAVEAVQGLKEFKIVFDLVDEQNVYWFSANTNLDFVTDSISYEYNILNIFKTNWSKVFGEQKIIFLFNIVGIFIFIYLAYKYKHEFV
ncbi:hypothetical protein NE664_05615 [Anaerotignum faecicola]|nr:hypothetical protein [Anaerotignum faecicola]